MIENNSRCAKCVRRGRSCDASGVPLSSGMSFWITLVLAMALLTLCFLGSEPRYRRKTSSREGRGECGGGTIAFAIASVRKICLARASSSSMKVDGVQGSRDGSSWPSFIGRA